MYKKNWIKAKKRIKRRENTGAGLRKVLEHAKGLIVYVIRFMNALIANRRPSRLRT